MEDLNITQVDHQETVLNAINMIHRKVFDYETETVQSLISLLNCLAKELQNKLTVQLSPSLESNNDVYFVIKMKIFIPFTNNTITPTLITNGNNTNSRRRNSFFIELIDLTPTSLRNNIDMKDDENRVSIDTLTRVSKIVSIIDLIINKLYSKPFNIYCHYRTIRSLLVALSIELTSTAQRDQFVDKPNEIIEKCVKSTANYCDKISFGKIDCLFIQPFCLEFIQLRRHSSLIA